MMASALFDKKFWDISKTVYERYKDLFQQLEDYDKTHKLRKIRYKKRVDLTIDAQLWNKFKNYCQKKGMKMSNVVENLIEHEISKKSGKHVHKAYIA